MADLIPWSNLLPQYQSPQTMAQMGAATQQSQAATGLLQAQTQGADISNQSNALSLQALQQAMNGTPPGGGTSTTSPGSGSGGSQPIGGTNFSTDDVTNGIVSKYAPIPTAPPQSVLQQMYAFSRAGKPEIATAIKAQYDAQVAGINQQRQLGANATYQMAQQVADSPEGAAFETLNRYDPQAAAAFKASHPSDDPAQLDADARLLAQHTGITVHQYTGRDTDFQNGVLVDKKDGKPVLGSEQVLTGLDAAGKQKAFEEANTPVQVGDQLPQPRWQAAGFKSPEAYVIAADRAARSSAAAAPASNGLPAAVSSAAPSASTASKAPTKNPPASAPPGQDPALRDALSDPMYKYKPPTLPPPRNQEELEANKATAQDAAKNYQANANSLKTSSDEVASASAKALQYFNAAKMILAQPDSKWAAGMPGEVNAMLSKLGITTDAGTTRAEVVKNLTQAALQGLKTTYGTKPAMFDVKVNLEQAFPDIKGDQGLPAVRNLIDENIRNLNYDVASGRRVLPYLNAGNDPSQFNTWNEQKFQRSANVNEGGSRAPSAQGNSSLAVGTVRGGYKYTGGDPANKSNWAKQ